MLELRVTADARRIASMVEAIRRECARVNAGSAHAEKVAMLAEQLVDGNEPARGTGRRVGRSTEVLVIVTVQSDVTMLMVRDQRPAEVELGDRRHRLLEEHTARWSTIAGREGRTIWAEIARPTTPEPAPAPSTFAGVPAPAAPRASRSSRLLGGARIPLRQMPSFAAPD